MNSRFRRSCLLAVRPYLDRGQGDASLRSPGVVSDRRSRGLASVIDLERALSMLPDHQRVVVVLHDVEGYTHDEIARQLGIASGTAKATLSRARSALRRMLNDGVSHVG